MNYKSLIMAVLAGALVATSCMKNLESASVTKVRDAKAEELKSLAELNKAQAAAATTLANAEASLKLAQAKVAEAQAAKLNAETEMLKAQLEYQIAYYKSLIEQISFNMELAALRHEKEMAEAYAALLTALEAADEATFTYATELIEHIAIEDGTVQELAGMIAANEAKIVLLKEGLESIEEYTLEEVLDARAEIARLQNVNEYLTECLKYDSRTLQNTISALKVERMRVNDELEFVSGQVKSLAGDYDGIAYTTVPEVESKIRQSLNALPTDYVNGTYMYYDFKKGKFVPILSESSIGLVGCTENEPMSYDLDNLTEALENNLAFYSDIYVARHSSVMSYELYYFGKNGAGEPDKLVLGSANMTNSEFEEHNAKQAELAKEELDSAQEAFDKASEDRKAAVDVRNAASVEYLNTLLTLKKAPGASEYENSIDDLVSFQKYIQELTENREKAAIECNEHNLEAAKDAKLKADRDFALIEPEYQAASDSSSKASAACTEASQAVDAAKAIVLAKTEAYDAAREAENSMYIEWKLAAKDNESAKKAAYDSAVAATAKANKELDEAYDELLDAKTKESQAKAKYNEVEAEFASVNRKFFELMNAKYEAEGEVSYAEQCLVNYNAVDAEWQEAIENYDLSVKDALAWGAPVELFTTCDAKVALDNANDGVVVASEAASAARKYLRKANEAYNFFASNVEDCQNNEALYKKGHEDHLAMMEKLGSAVQEVLDEDYDGYVAMVERLNTISESYNESVEMKDELVGIKKDLKAQINALSAELEETGKLEAAIKAHEARIAELEAYVAALLDGTTIEAEIASLEHKNEMLKEELEAHQIILEALHAELENLLGVETEDSPVQE